MGLKVIQKLKERYIAHTFFCKGDDGMITGDEGTQTKWVEYPEALVNPSTQYSETETK
jgi:hypothetical protein